MILSPKCYERGCKHYLGVKTDNDVVEKNERHYCGAYLNGIPEEIVMGEDLHLTVREDQDNAIVFEQL